MSHNVLLAGLFAFGGFYAFFMLADYGWEKRKRRGLDRRARRGRWSEEAEHSWYSWTRYLAVILLTYLNAVVFIQSQPDQLDQTASPVRILLLLGIAVLFSIALLALDGSWDRSKQRGMNRAQSAAFWSYFWLRYPALIILTVQLTRHGFRS
jgi:hypothetical protein